MEITVKTISVTDADYERELCIRDEILRRPLGQSLYADKGDENGDFHVAAYSGVEMVGCLFLTPIDADTVKMRQLAVLERFQGRGIGKTMVRFAEKFAADRGYKRIILDARIVAENFYLKLGYTVESERFIIIGIEHKKMKKELV